MGFIYFMSSRDATTSSGYSMRFGTNVCELLVPGFKNLCAEDQLKMAEMIETPIRKCAHFFEYTVLGILSYMSFTSYPVALTFSSIYAVSDEIHQMFVPGRSCELRDMIIDIGGVLLGLLLTFFFRNLLEKVKNKKASE